MPAILTCVRSDLKVSLRMAQWVAGQLPPQWVWDCCPGNSIDSQRNYLIECHRGETILFLDSDVLPPPNAIGMLLGLDVPVAAGICPIEVNGTSCWNVAGGEGYRSRGEPLPAAPFLVERAGTACLLIEPGVFDSLPWPWFQTEIRHAKPGDGELLARSDDEYFCDLCGANGIPILAHPGVICEHPV